MVLVCGEVDNAVSLHAQRFPLLTIEEKHYLVKHLSPNTIKEIWSG